MNEPLFSRALEKINNFENNPAKFMGSASSLEVIELICFKLEAETINQLYETKTGVFLARLLNHLESVKNEIYFVGLDDLNLNSKRIKVLFLLNHIFNKIFLLSLPFRRLFTNTNEDGKIYLECFIKFIQDLQFIERLMELDNNFDG